MMLPDDDVAGPNAITCLCCDVSPRNIAGQQ